MVPIFPEIKSNGILQDSTQTSVQDIKTPALPLGDLTDSSILPDMMGLDHVGSGTDLVDPSLGEGQVLHGSLDQVAFFKEIFSTGFKLWTCISAFVMFNSFPKFYLKRFLLTCKQISNA